MIDDKFYYKMTLKQLVKFSKQLVMNNCVWPLKYVLEDMSDGALGEDTFDLAIDKFV